MYFGGATPWMRWPEQNSTQEEEDKRETLLGGRRGLECLWREEDASCERALITAVQQTGRFLGPGPDREVLHGKPKYAGGKDHQAIALYTRSSDVVLKEYHIMSMFTKVDQNHGLQEKFKICMKSMVEHASFRDDEILHFHLVTDESSRALGEKLLSAFLSRAAFATKVSLHSAQQLAAQLVPLVQTMQRHFSAGTSSYFGDSIFFLSVAMHRILPFDVERIILLDLDLKFKTSIRLLFTEFDQFKVNAAIGIAYEMQPVYRHTLWQYKRENGGTPVGEPPPHGFPGFNSGVLLLDLNRLRRSVIYNELLTPAAVELLAEMFHFQGHLGDQDFFTLVGVVHPELFHVLSCSWNRQLCTWWRQQGYAAVFDDYFRCNGAVHIYHGNCNTAIPND
uniref:xyloside xylosyltransferase 1 isoform X1 n=2 Tax=Myxine glutinosa TaxID=7769 RepID=UPI00358EC674